MKVKNYVKACKLIIYVMIIVGLLTSASGCARSEEDAFFSAVDQDEENSESEMIETPEVIEPEEETTQISVTEMPSQEIYVDVCGEVESPGVYRLQEPARVFEAIECAGGYTKEAADSYLNRASLLQDGQQIYVPSRQELEEHILENSEIEGLQEDSLTASDQSSSDDSKININEADAEKLMQLSGIGEAKALAIVQYREEHGAFSSIEEIKNVSGIKGGTYDKIKDGITIG